MKIAFLSFYQNSYTRGVEAWLQELFQQLQGSLEAKIFSSPQLNFASPDMSRSVLRKAFLDPYSLLILKNMLTNWKKLKDFDCLVPLNGGWQMMLAKLLSLRFKKKILLVGHTGLGYDEKWNLWWKPDLYLALTSYQAKWASQYFSGPIKVIPNGVNLQKFNPQGKKLNLELKKPVVLCAADLQKKEYFKNLILAVKKNKASLLIAGSGDKKQEKEIERLGKKYLAKRFLRRQFDLELMPALYRSCDLFVYPNPKWESFGMVFLEALASNLPVVATDDQIRREMIGKAGLFCRPESVNSLTREIGKAFKIKWKDRPRKQAEKYDWKIVAEKYKEVFKNLVKDE